MNFRLAKQIIYGIGYLLVLFLIVFVVYLLWFKPAPTCFDNNQNQAETGVDCGGPCTACEIINLSPLQLSQVKFFPADNQTVIMAEIKNPNFNYGADSFDYTITIYPVRNEISNGVYGTSTAKIQTITGSSFIYSGETKYILEPVEVDSKNISNVKISFSNPNWKSAKDFPKPEIQLRETNIEPAATRGLIINGSMANTNAFSLSKIRIIAFLFNSFGVQISASKTEMENVSAFQEKSFQINFPKNISLMSTSTTPQANSAKADSSKTKFYTEAIR